MAELDLSDVHAPSRGLTRREAAEFLGISEETLRAWEAAGIGPTVVRISERKAIYPRAALSEYLARNTRGGTSR